VKAGDPIALLQPDNEVVKADRAGKVIAKAPLVHGDDIEQRMVDHNIATLDESLPPLSVGDGQEGAEAQRGLYFKRWRKNLGDHVNKDEAIAEVSTKNNLQNGGWGTISEIPASNTGTIISREPLVAGDAVGEIKQNSDGYADIAVIGSDSPPWWPWLLLALLLCCLLLLCLFCMKPAKTKETYSPMPVVTPPPPVREPDGLRLDFDDHSGNIKTIYATRRPLGMTNQRSAPIDVLDFTFNSYLKGLGIQRGWTIVRVGKVDVRGITDYERVTGLINNGLKDMQIYPLKLEFIKQGESGRRYWTYENRPLGFEFDNLAPITVKNVYPNSHAEALGMKDYEKDREVWTMVKCAETETHEDDHDFEKIFGYLKEGTIALDPYTANDGSRSVDQLRGWD